MTTRAWIRSMPLATDRKEREPRSAAEPSRIVGGFAVLTALLAPNLSVGQLPPDIMMDKHLLRAEQSIREKDYPGARAEMEQILSLQEEHGLKPEPEDHFRHAKAWYASGAPEQAIESLVRYLQLLGRKAEHYIEALELMNSAEADKASAEAEPAAPTRSEPEAPGIELAGSREPTGDRSPKWDDLLRRGETAEDNEDYKTAEELLTRACRLLAAKLPDSSTLGRRASACMRLAQFHAVQGDLNKADKVLHQLLKTLQPLTSLQPLDIIEVLLLRAEVHAAQSKLDSTAATLKDVIPLLNGLTRTQRSRALARMSEFYVSAENLMALNNPKPLTPTNRNRMAPTNRNRMAREFGARLLEQAQAEIEAERDFDSAEYVAAATDVAAVFRLHGRRADSIGILKPIVAHMRTRFAQPSNLVEDMIQANLRAATAYLRALREEGRERVAGKLQQEVTEWRRNVPRISSAQPSTVKNVGGDVQPPRLVWKPEPSYTPGAKNAHVEGQVALSLEVWPDGRAHNIQVIRRLPFGLTWSAIRAVREWRFKPGSLLGEPVKVRAVVEVNFRLL